MAKKNTLEQFVEHQKTAAEEAGKALLSLIPPGIRTHGWKAIEETTKGFVVLVEGAATEFKKTLDGIDDKTKSSEAKSPATKVRVDMDKEN